MTNPLPQSEIDRLRELRKLLASMSDANQADAHAEEIKDYLAIMLNDLPALLDAAEQNVKLQDANDAAKKLISKLVVEKLKLRALLQKLCDPWDDDVFCKLCGIHRTHASDCEWGEVMG